MRIIVPLKECLENKIYISGDLVYINLIIFFGAYHFICMKYDTIGKEKYVKIFLKECIITEGELLWEMKQML